MDHGGMEHGGHSGHVPDDSSIPCKMSMLWNTDPMGACLVFPSLQITSSGTLVFYLVAIILLSMLCEYLRLSLATFDRALRSKLRGGPSSTSASASAAGLDRSRASTPSGLRRASSFAAPGVGGGVGDGGEEALLGVGASRTRYWGVVRLPWFVQFRRSFGYALHVALTFYIMLLVMSYNAQIIGAIVLGAFLGHFIFQRNIDLGVGVGDDDGKGLQCH
ncbi:copper transporter family protein [Rhodotorula paludigena]|uniref:copper transporter family protein n=1 Tax=Rhodotorula paludigena TaxID=86838 RepID=UPI0031773BA1